MCVSPGFDAYLENAYLAKYVRQETPLDLERVRAESRQYCMLRK